MSESTKYLLEESRMPKAAAYFSLASLRTPQPRILAVQRSTVFNSATASW
jgi:hypothetical protein